MPKNSSAKKAVEAETPDNAAEHDNIVSLFSERLKAFGVDTDIMSEAAKERAADLQKMFLEELKDRPVRTLGAAAAIGLFVGFLVSR